MQIPLFQCPLLQISEQMRNSAKWRDLPVSPLVGLAVVSDRRQRRALERSGPIPEINGL